MQYVCKIFFRTTVLIMNFYCIIFDNTIHGSTCSIIPTEITSAPLTAKAIYNPGGSAVTGVNSTSWHPSGVYVVTGSGNGIAATQPSLELWEFSATGPTLTSKQQIDPGNPTSYISPVLTVAWSPDGSYLAVGGAPNGSDGSTLEIYVFNPSVPSLTRIDSQNPPGGSSVLSMSWSPSGNHLIVGVLGSSGSSKTILLYDVNTYGLLTLNREFDPTDLISGYSVAWSNCGNYIAVGGSRTGANTSSNLLQVYHWVEGSPGYFAGETGTPTSLVTETPIALTNPGGTSQITDLLCVAWSPTNQYLAVGGYDTNASVNVLLIYEFTGSTLNLITSFDPGYPSSDVNRVNSVAWSPCGRYLLVGGGSSTTFTGNDTPAITASTLELYQFDGATLTKRQSENPPLGLYDDIATVKTATWHPSGGYATVGGFRDASSASSSVNTNTLALYTINYQTWPGFPSTGINAYIATNTAYTVGATLAALYECSTSQTTVATWLHAGVTQRMKEKADFN